MPEPATIALITSAISGAAAKSRADQAQQQSQAARAETQLNNAIGKIGVQPQAAPTGLQALLAQIQRSQV